MKHSTSFAIASLLVMGALGASPAAARAKHSMHHRTVTCTEIKNAVASGKSEQAAATDLKVSSARVKECTTPTTKHHSHAHTTTSKGS